MSEVKVNKISPRTNCGTVTVGDAGDSVTVTAGVPVTVNGDLKSNALKAIDGGSIISQCGTNITLGASGDTINLAAGASQTGFGRTGTVDWDTTAKTAGFTAVSGNGYFINTTSGAITITLPATPSAGDIVAVKDYAQTFNTNNVTLARNGSNIEGAAADVTLDGQAESVTFVYVDSTKGWVLVGESLTKYGPAFVAATGGTVTCCGDYKIHTFTSPGTFTVTCAGNSGGSNTVDYLVVAGGGGGGACRGGGGGAGGFRESHSTPVSGCYTASPLATPTGILVSATGYPITVGGGGTGGTIPVPGPTGDATRGSNSVFSTITSTGGGGGSYNATLPVGPGGSGGGGGISSPAGTGNTPPTSPAQGTNGGAGGASGSGGGGGGATVAGTVGGPGAPSNGGPGGGGATTSINATPTARAGGGGGGSYFSTGGTGGTGGGGPGGSGCSSSGTAGTTNTGGGGGGGSAGGGPGAVGGAGGSGIVIIRYKYQ